MKEQLYFDPYRKHHTVMLNVLNKEFYNVKGVEFVKFGDRTQHLFKDGKYVMTVNWSLV